MGESLMTDLAKLREIAEKATPGPWASTGSGKDFVHQEDDDGRWGLFVARCDMLDEGAANAAFIATFNPQTVLALLDRIEKAERQFAQMTQQHPSQPAKSTE